MENQYYAIKVKHPASSHEIARRMMWCTENGIDVITQQIMGVIFNGDSIEQHEFEDYAKTHNNITAQKLKSMMPINIYTAIAFEHEEDVMAFKLVWPD